MIKIHFPCGKSRTSREEIELMQLQFRAATGKLLCFEGWNNDRVASFRVYSSFAD
jgi:hypothetical protein